MTRLDGLALAIYLAGVLALGLIFSRRARHGAEFLLAGRSMRWLPVGLSVMVTAFSALNYIAFPTEVAGHGLYVTASLPVFVLIAWPVTRVFMPFFHPMKLTSAYEYFERRFDHRVRSLAAGLFLLWQVFWMAAALYAAGRALGALTGWDFRLLIVAAGATAIVYTSLGGMRAVLWTDAAQFVVLFGGIALALTLTILRTDGGLGGLLASAEAGGRLRPFAPVDAEWFSADPRVRISLWSGLLGTAVMFAARYGADQTVIQRYFAARSLRDAQRGFWLNVICVMAALSLLLLLGLAVFAHAEQLGPAAQARPAIANLASLIHSLPAGMTGLVAAGLMAATMSSLDSGVHACASVYLVDIHQRLAGPLGDRAQSRVAGAATLVVGAAAIGLAVGLLPRMGSLFVVATRLVNALGSPLLGLMLLGMFSRRANAVGVLIGGAVGAICSVGVSLGAETLALHYHAVVNLLGTLAAGWLLSLLAERFGAGNLPSQLAWTWAARRPGR